MIDIIGMQQVLLKVITLFVLVSNVVWPALAYCDLFAIQDHQSFQAMEAGSPLSQDVEQACHHCDHMSVHLVGFVLSNRTGDTQVSTQVLVFTRHEYPPGYFSPPYHPPTV